jgi:hypothetical protein
MRCAAVAPVSPEHSTDGPQIQLASFALKRPYLELKS